MLGKNSTIRTEPGHDVTIFL